MLPKIIIVTGTNASGKSNLGIKLAKRFNGEIISADSRQVFRGLDLGSGKITPEEMNGVVHHLIDVCEPNDFFSVADFQRLAYEAIDDILSRGKIPFIVGGTGLYVDSVADGYSFSGKMPDLAYREELEKLTTEELYVMFQKKLPDVEVDPRNRNRVMRYLEKLHDGDDVIPTKNPRYECLRLGVTWDRQVLRDRIDERLEKRLNEGMIQEVDRLLKAGATEEFMIKLGLEYKFITQYLRGDYSSVDEMKELLATAIKQFAKRQMIWFRRDKDIRWIDMQKDPETEAAELITAFLA